MKASAAVLKTAHDLEENGPGAYEDASKLPTLNRYNVRALAQSGGKFRGLDATEDDRKSDLNQSVSQASMRQADGLEGFKSKILRQNRSQIKLREPDQMSHRSRQYGNPSVVSTLSKAKSVASLRHRNMENKRAQNFNTDLTLKLSYAWKQIYRQALQFDILSKGRVPVKQFNQALLSNNVVLTKEEIRRLVKLSLG